MTETNLYDDLLDDVTLENDEQNDNDTQDVDVNENNSEDTGDEVTEDVTDESVDDDNEDDNNDFQYDENDNIVNIFLKSHGLDDGKTLTFENEDGEIETYDFDTLTKEEQLNVLREISKPNLTPDEISTINFLRENKTNLTDVINLYKEQAVKEYIEQNGNSTSSVDSYSNEELYVIDLKQRMPDLTDDEISEDLQLAKSNEALFNKKMDKVRENYKTQEDNEVERGKQAAQQQQEEFQSQIKSSLDQFNDVVFDPNDPQSVSLTIEDSDKDAVYEYLFNLDLDGKSEFYKDLHNPEALIQLAWYRLYGQNAIADVSNYWKSELKKSRKQVSKPQEPTAKATVVSPSTNQERSQTEDANDIRSLWDNEEWFK